jgi:hypothetical protein
VLTLVSFLTVGVSHGIWVEFVSHFFLLWSKLRLSFLLLTPCLEYSTQEGPFPLFIAFDLGSYPPRLKFWRTCLLVMFLLGIFSGVMLCIVFLRFCLYHLFWIIDSWWLTNYSTGREGPLVFIFKLWSHLLEGVGFYTNGSSKSVHETFMDMKNPSRNELVCKKVMANFIKDTNQGTPSQGDYCSFPFFRNIGETWCNADYKCRHNCCNTMLHLLQHLWHMLLQHL